PVCGETFDTDSYGTIASPGTPGNYPPNRDCEWHITAPYGKYIQLHFFTMHLESHETCQYDYVAIYSGSSTFDTLLKKFCNTSRPEPLTILGNRVVVQFHSDETGSDAGFQIHYTVIEGLPGCGGVFTASEGEFGPPIQNDVYQMNMLCEYLIRMPVGSRIQIKFKSFQLEDTRNCELDYVEIFEGTSDKHPKVNRYCGNAVPPPYTSLGNSLLMVFKSDISGHYEGFRVTYEVVCGGLFENETGVITSPLYPNPYKASHSCYYEILAPLGKAISLHFEDFDIENPFEEYNCDFVSVFDGFDVNSTEIGKYCGTSLPPDTISTLNVLLLLLQSDVSISGKGFKASYSFVDVKCGGVIRKLGHEILSPKQPVTDHGHNAECVWIIVAPEGFLVQLTFTDFSLEDSKECSLDSVTLYEGSASNGTKIHTYCGISLPPVTQSTNNVLSIKYISGSSDAVEGFRAQYVFIDSQTACGGTFYTSSGNLRSPGWPSKYPRINACTWTLIAPTGQQIELLVNAFELEERLHCDSDYLEI
ncbi:Cubilin like, partial [Pseudolycoriella hygida]